MCPPQVSLASTVVDVATFAQLKEAVHDKTSGPSTLRITDDIYFPTDGSVPSGGIILKYPLRIVGACSSTSLVISGTVATGTCMLDAKEVDRHFQVNTAQHSTSEVIFEKLALVNGKKRGSSDSGGAVRACGTGATRFENVIFKDNTVPGSGGAVFAHWSGKATFTSCRFLGNKAAKGGPFTPIGGAVYTHKTASSFTACTFENNEAAAAVGAAASVILRRDGYARDTSFAHGDDGGIGVWRATQSSSFLWKTNEPSLDNDRQPRTALLSLLGEGAPSGIDAAAVMGTHNCTSTCACGQTTLDDNANELKLGSSQQDTTVVPELDRSFCLCRSFVYTARRLPSVIVAEPASRIDIIATARHHMAQQHAITCDAERR
ncbi:EF-hand domain-containing protein [Pycnococcus provasolii]